MLRRALTLEGGGGSEHAEPRARGSSSEGLHSEQALSVLLALVAVGILGIVVYSLQAWQGSEIAAIASTGILVAGSSLLAGGLLGFVFGIPRTLQGESLEEETADEGVSAPAENRGRINTRYSANTNLEQISDWLTKILVGVGLTQITAVVPALVAFSDYLEPRLGETPSSGLFGVTVLLYFIFCGFLIGYLWTRLYFHVALKRADVVAADIREAVSFEVRSIEDNLSHEVHELRGTIHQEVKAASDEVSTRLDRQSQVDERARGLVQRQLSSTIEDLIPRQEELNECLQSASRSLRIEAFNLAWQPLIDPNADKDAIRRTIPVWRALISADANERFFRNHANLGYALMSQPTPDWQQAEAAYTRAIEIRDRQGISEPAWYQIELYRALCRIKLDEDFNQGMPSDPESGDEILRDLRESVKSPRSQQLVKGLPDIKEWLRLNDRHEFDEVDGIPYAH